jgi:hypothetical protein
MTPNWQTTASKDASGYGRLSASAGSNRTADAASNFDRATTNMSSFRSVATSDDSGGSADRIAAETMPVPAAVSRARAGARPATRCAISAA